MKVISFSLYGDNPKYTIGAIKNSEVREKFYPDWQMRVYHNDSVPNYVLEQLEANNVVLINTKVDQNVCNAMWRFAPASEEGVEYFISRDCDSRLFERDVAAVEEWIASGKDFHIIRDHPGGHAWEISAGMWGAKGGFIENIKEKMDQYTQTSSWVTDRAVDQRFLQEIIYPQALTSLFVNDEYFNYEGIGTPIKRDRKLDDFAFIGEPFDENDDQLANHRDMIIQRY
jgi:protein O-GlcNAc transferase